MVTSDTNNPGFLKIHFFYIVLILTLVIVFLMTDRWTNQGNFTEYLTNAGTMVSLVLALVAIFYAFITNSGLSKSLGEINKISEDFSSSNRSILSLVEKAEVITKTGSTNTDRISNISLELKENVARLETGLVSLSAQTTSLLDTVSQLPSQLGGLEKGILDTRHELLASLQTPNPTTSKINMVTSVASRVMENSSVHGLFLIFTCSLSYKSRKPFTIPMLIEAVGASDASYFFGYLVALRSTGLIKTALTSRDEENVIEGVDEEIISGIKSSLEAKLKIHYETKAPDWYAQYLAAAKKLESFFTTQPSQPQPGRAL
jgi:hypothetical protein